MITFHEIWCSSTQNQVPVHWLGLSQRQVELIGLDAFYKSVTTAAWQDYRALAAQNAGNANLAVLSSKSQPAASVPQNLR